jgi:hypothetical protein
LDFARSRHLFVAAIVFAHGRVEAASSDLTRDRNLSASFAGTFPEQTKPQARRQSSAKKQNRFLAG